MTSEGGGGVLPRAWDCRDELLPARSLQALWADRPDQAGRAVGQVGGGAMHSLAAAKRHRDDPKVVE